MTETVPFATGEQIQFLNLVNPDPDPDEAFDLRLRVGVQGGPPGPVTDQLVLVFVDAAQGQSDCYLCFVEWLARLLDFNPGFNDLFYLDLEEQEASPQWDYYTAMFGIYEPEITDLVAEPPSLLWSSLQMMNGWTPAVQDLAAGTGDQATITQAMVDDMVATFDGLKAEAGPGLQAAIQREQDALDLPSFVGMDMEAAWDEFVARRPISQTYVMIILEE